MHDALIVEFATILNPEIVVREGQAVLQEDLVTVKRCSRHSLFGEAVHTMVDGLPLVPLCFQCGSITVLHRTITGEGSIFKVTSV